MVEQQAIKDFADAIAREFQPEKIVLFGSYAWGTPNEDSDVDVLVLIRNPGNNVAKASEIAMRVPHSFALDILVRDPEVVAYRVSLNDWFLREIMERGKVLYESAYA